VRQVIVRACGSIVARPQLSAVLAEIPHNHRNPNLETSSTRQTVDLTNRQHKYRQNGESNIPRVLLGHIGHLQCEPSDDRGAHDDDDDIRAHNTTKDEPMPNSLEHYTAKSKNRTRGWMG
jgi:hypothetical protein